MTTPPTDDSASDPDPPTDDRSTEPETPTDEPPETAVDRPDDAIEPPTRTAERQPHQPPAAAPPDSTDHQSTPRSGETTATGGTDPATAGLDSNWWYAVAAVPLYVVVGIVGGVFAFVLFVFGIAVDVGGGMGVATGLIAVLLTLGVIGYALAGLALSILFPVGIYLDAKALAAADTEWEPDAVLYLLVAAASVVLSAFTLSAVVALYYLYRRNGAVGVP